MSFQERQRQKREKASQGQGKTVESLADRRKKRQNHLIDPDSVDQLGSDLDKLKQNAENMDRSKKSKGADGSVGAAEPKIFPKERKRTCNSTMTIIKQKDA